LLLADGIPIGEDEVLGFEVLEGEEDIGRGEVEESGVGFETLVEAAGEGGGVRLAGHGAEDFVGECRKGGG